jgi:SAM-dependent methyltransferase
LPKHRPPPFPKAIDIGCGHGRHSELLEDFGFIVDACDSSKKAYAPLENGGKFVVAEMWALPFEEGIFDAALAYGVFYYGTRAGHQKAVKEMHRVLRHGGHGFVCIRSDRDWRFDADMTDEPEEGMTLDLVAESELESLYGVFSEWSYERSELTERGRQRMNSDWLITVTK